MNDNRAKIVAKNTIYLYIRMIVTMIISLYTSRIVLENLGISDFGLYNVVGGFIALFSFINNSMAQSTQRFITYSLGERVELNTKVIFSQSFYIHAIIAGLILFVSETIGIWYCYRYLVIEPGREFAAMVIYQISILVTLINVLVVPFRAMIVAYEKMTSFAYITIIEVIMKLIIAIVLPICLWDKLIVYGILMTIVTIITAFCYIIYSINKFCTCRLIRVSDKKIVKEMTSFASWSILGSLAAIGSGQGLNVLINVFFGTTINAARGISVQIQSIVRGFASNFQIALNPQITKSYASENNGYFFLLIFKGSLYSFFLFFFFAFPVFMEIDQFLKIWLVEVPEHSNNFVRLMLIISCVEVLASSLNVGIQANGSIRALEITVSIILLMILPVSYITLKFIAIPELVFVINLLFIIFAQLARMYIARKLFQLPIRDYCKLVIIPILLVIISSSIIPICLKCILENTLLISIFIIFISFVTSIISILYLGLEKTDRIKLYTFLLLKLKTHNE
jgi:O-antigen/teichoic acid export membrane protein